ncbi:MAG: 50S ribosomal protein L32 [Planctomycetota bacterium]|nr:MAG: 50S ribosomal protein L32 [Planctomycetota bacterium]
MAVPKHRTSKARKRKRRSHLALKEPASSSCERCGANKVPHAVCESCGYYRGRNVLALDA